jgi:hypothetical protein
MTVVAQLAVAEEADWSSVRRTTNPLSVGFSEKVARWPTPSPALCAQHRKQNHLGPPTSSVGITSTLFRINLIFAGTNAIYVYATFKISVYSRRIGVASVIQSVARTDSASQNTSQICLPPVFRHAHHPAQHFLKKGRCLYH